MVRSIFIDTSGFYALLVKGDAHHNSAKAAVRSFQKRKIRVVTTDYVIDESITLLIARGYGSAVTALVEMLRSTVVLELLFVQKSQFLESLKMVEKPLDQGYSFTDCTSFVVMRELDIREALTSDKHFAQAGFRPRLS